MPIQTVNPATGALLRTFEPLESEAVAQRIGLAHQAYTRHRAIPLEHRALCTRKLAVLLEEERDELSRLITLEMGKPITGG